MKLLVAVTTVLLLGIGAAGAQPPPSYAPVPPPRHESMPPPPHPRAIWQPGHWHWTGMRYDWMPGHYVERHPHYGRWVEGNWIWAPREGRWVWRGAHWE